MDHLFLNTIAFPVERGVLYRGREELGDYCWELEINCGESPQLDFRNWADDREETADDLLAGTPLLLSAQRLPLRVQSPEELVGREYLFPPTPEPDPSEWQDANPVWPYFFLYVWEGCPTEQLRVAFTGQRGRQSRVEIAGGYSNSGVSYTLRVQAWLDWQAPEA
ncbi:MAG: hypothetical protein K2V38_14640 [Gemmataceae bacterium]|nr:hypothetical protein [Gemmataceae bacterium]